MGRDQGSCYNDQLWCLIKLLTSRKSRLGNWIREWHLSSKFRTIKPFTLVKDFFNEQEVSCCLRSGAYLAGCVKSTWALVHKIFCKQNDWHLHFGQSFLTWTTTNWDPPSLLLHNEKGMEKGIFESACWDDFCPDIFPCVFTTLQLMY